MPLLLALPTETPLSLVPLIEKVTPRLDGIMAALRGDCVHTVSAIYREIPTKDTPVLTDLLHAFQEGDREEVSDLRLDYPDIPEECFDCSPETNNIGGPGETVDVYDMRIQSALRLAVKLGRNVLIVAPTHVIKHITGITLHEGEVLPWNLTSS